MNCPNCNSDKIQKKGKRNNKQRYKCSICNITFTEGIEWKSQKKYKNTNRICPICKSHNIQRDGKLENGNQRYICKDCGKRFSTKTNKEALKPIKWSCPYCGGILSYSGYGKLGQREYLCKDCGKSCSHKENKQPEKHITFEETNTSISCPTCGSYRIKSAGNVDGKRYICKECGRAFKEGSKKQERIFVHNKQIEIKAIQEILKGKEIKIVAEKYNYKLRTLQNIIRPYYKQEKINRKQKTDIIKYGVNCAIPAEYVAPYIPCSIKLCKDILKNYKINKVLYKRTEKEKKFDWLELDKFTG